MLSRKEQLAKLSVNIHRTGLAMLSYDVECTVGSTLVFLWFYYSFTVVSWLLVLVDCWRADVHNRILVLEVYVL